MDDIILFDQLQSADIIKIVEIELDDFSYRMSENGYFFKFTKQAKEGYDAAYRARPIKRAIQKYVEDIVADAILYQSIEKQKEYSITKKPTDDKLFIKL